MGLHCHERKEREASHTFSPWRRRCDEGVQTSAIRKCPAPLTPLFPRWRGGVNRRAWTKQIQLASLGVATVSALLSFAQPLHAAGIDAFYKGRSISIIIGY